MSFSLGAKFCLLTYGHLYLFLSLWCLMYYFQTDKLEVWYVFNRRYIIFFSIQL